MLYIYKTLDLYAWYASSVIYFEYIVINYTFKMLFCVILLFVMEICTSLSGTIMN